MLTNIQMLNKEPEDMITWVFIDQYFGLQLCVSLVKRKETQVPKLYKNGFLRNRNIAFPVLQFMDQTFCYTAPSGHRLSNDRLGFTPKE